MKPLAELYAERDALNAEIKKRLAASLDGFFGALAAHYGTTPAKLKRCGRACHEAKRVASYYLVALKGLPPGSVAKDLGISRQMVGRHVRTVNDWKNHHPRAYFKIMSDINTITE